MAGLVLILIVPDSASAGVACVPFFVYGRVDDEINCELDLCYLEKYL